MAAKYLASKQVTNKYPAVSPGGAHDLVAARGDFTLTAALEADDVIEMVVLPPNVVVVDVILDTADIESSGTSSTLSVGTMAGTPLDSTLANRTVTENIVAASTVGQAGGIVRASVTGATRIATSDSERSIGVLVKAAPATGATSGVMSLTVLYRPQIHSA